MTGKNSKKNIYWQKTIPVSCDTGIVFLIQLDTANVGFLTLEMNPAVSFFDIIFIELLTHALDYIAAGGGYRGFLQPTSILGAVGDGHDGQSKSRQDDDVRDESKELLHNFPPIMINREEQSIDTEV